MMGDAGLGFMSHVSEIDPIQPWFRRFDRSLA